MTPHWPSNLEVMDGADWSDTSDGSDFEDETICTEQIVPSREPCIPLVLCKGWPSNLELMDGADWSDDD